VAVDTLADLETAHRQAALALRTVPAERSAVAAFDECLPDALLLRSPDIAERLAASWLAPVLALPLPERTPLLQTLETWVATAGSTTRTAEVVHCHRNTVINRLRRVGELVGRVLVDQPPPLELALALHAHRLGAET
jgi:DNA-binding PucR family transcriptional regulator